MSTNDLSNSQGYVPNKTLNETESDSDEYFIPTSQPCSLKRSDSLVLMGNSKKTVDETAETLEESYSTIEETIPLDSSCLIADTQVVESVNDNDKSWDIIPSSEIRSKKDVKDPFCFKEPSCKKRLEDDEIFTADSQLHSPDYKARLFSVAESPSILDTQNASVIEETPLNQDEEDHSNSITVIFTDDNKISQTSKSDCEESVTEVSPDANNSGDVKKSSDDQCITLNSNSKCKSASTIKIDFNLENKNDDDVVVIDIPFQYSAMSGSSSSNQEDNVKSDNVHSTNSKTEESVAAALKNDIDFPPVSSATCSWSSHSIGSASTLPVSLTPPLSREVNESNEHRRSLVKNPVGNALDQVSSQIPSHSTPDNSISKSPKINASASSIENLTPSADVHPENHTDEEDVFSFQVDLKVTCKVHLNRISHQPNKKVVMEVRPVAGRIPSETPDDNCNVSKMRYSSSSGSVFSDKSGLPYCLQKRVSDVSSTSSESCHSYETWRRTKTRKMLEPWVNEVLFPKAIDDILPRKVEQYLQEKNASQGKRTKRSNARVTSHNWKKKGSVPLEELQENCPGPSGIREGEQSTQELNEATGPKDDQECEQVNISDNVNVSEEKVHVSGGDLSSEPKPAEVREVSSEDDSDDTLRPGLKVFAQWADKRYYSGKLQDYSKYDRWNVNFDDDNKKTLREDLIIPHKWLVRGQVVLALVNEEYMSGKIVDIKPGKVSKYKVELDNSNQPIEVKASDLCLTDDIANILKEDHKALTVTPARKLSADINCDNVVSGKRLRDVRTPVRTTPVPGPSSSSTSKKRKLASRVLQSPVMELSENESSIHETPSTNQEKGSASKSISENSEIPVPGSSTLKRKKPAAKVLATPTPTSELPENKSSTTSSNRDKKTASKRKIENPETPIPGPSTSSDLCPSEKIKKVSNSPVAVNEEEIDNKTVLKSPKAARKKKPAESSKADTKLDDKEESSNKTGGRSRVKRKVDVVRKKTSEEEVTPKKVMRTDGKGKDESRESVSKNSGLKATAEKTQNGKSKNKSASVDIKTPPSKKGKKNDLPSSKTGKEKSQNSGSVGLPGSSKKETPVVAKEQAQKDEKKIKTKSLTSEFEALVPNDEDDTAFVEGKTTRGRPKVGSSKTVVAKAKADKGKKAPVKVKVKQNERRKCRK